MANIKHNNYRNFKCHLLNDTKLDFMLLKHKITPIISDIKVSSKISFANVTKKHVISEIAWENATSTNDILKNIGYTGVDNGFFSYEKDRIANDEFLELFSNSHFDLSSYDKHFFVTEITGNTGEFVYPIEKNENYVSLKGGFYQGFFKINGSKYQTLPHDLNNEWIFEITLRKKDYKTPSNVLNKRHNNNKDIFFYIGTRAENKFWEFYKQNPEMSELKIYDDYFTDDYNNTICDCDCENNTSIFEDDYLLNNTTIVKNELEDSKGHNLYEKGFYEIETDNKFIFFNQTKNGFTKDNWKDEYKFVLTGKTDSPNINYYPYLNQTNKGYTKDNISELIEKHTYSYNIFKEIENNALALKINDDGSISYRYLSSNCEIIDETSKPNIILNDNWYNVKLIMKEYPGDKMKLYIYVNNYLKLVSKELPKIKLRPLNDSPERQEGVPYSLSIGGGTQGLCERILPDYYSLPEYILPIEKHFAGTFIGDIKTFTFSTNSEKECGN